MVARARLRVDSRILASPRQGDRGHWEPRSEGRGFSSAGLTTPKVGTENTKGRAPDHQDDHGEGVADLIDHSYSESQSAVGTHLAVGDCVTARGVAVRPVQWRLRRRDDLDRGKTCTSGSADPGGRAEQARPPGVDHRGR